MPCLLQKVDTATGEHVSIDLYALAKVVQAANPGVEILIEGQSPSPQAAMDEAERIRVRLKDKGLRNRR